MKTEKTPEKDINVVYRKDGKTPDLRYKISKTYVLSQHIDKKKKKTKDWKPFDLRYHGTRDHVLSQHTEKLPKTPVQIKPVGKKPVWKISS